MTWIRPVANGLVISWGYDLVIFVLLLQIVTLAKKNWLVRITPLRGLITHHGYVPKKAQGQQQLRFLPREIIWYGTWEYFRGRGKIHHPTETWFSGSMLICWGWGRIFCRESPRNLHAEPKELEVCWTLIHGVFLLGWILSLYAAMGNSSAYFHRRGR